MYGETWGPRSGGPYLGSSECRMTIDQFAGNFSAGEDRYEKGSGRTHCTEPQ